jgi:hypothetical protein
MSNNRVLLTKAEFEGLSQQFITEIHRLPLYDLAAKQRLALKYLRKVQDIIIERIRQLDSAESVKAAIDCDEPR